jgi:hypothetical protein
MVDQGGEARHTPRTNTKYQSYVCLALNGVTQDS